jgi:hypothetical protein
MKIWRLALFCFALGLSAAGQQESSAPPAAPQQTGSSIVVDAPATSDAPKPGLTADDLIPDAQGKLSQEQMQKLLRVVAEKDMENDKVLRNYTYIERDVQNQMDGKGDTKKTEVKTYEVLEIYGEQVRRLTEKDDQPLDAKEAAKEEEKIQKIIDKRKDESENDRIKREEKEEKDREDERKFVMEIADAYNFKLVGTEQVGGRDAWVIEGEPRPEFVPHMKDAHYLTKFHGRVWIDKDDLQLAKMDVECLDTITWGGFLARFHRGSRFMMEQTRVNDEVWLPRQIAGKIDARFALVKSYNLGFEQNFRDYKKFRTSSKIIGMGEAPEQK